MITKAQKIKLLIFLLGTTLIGATLLVVFTRQSLFKSNATYYVRVPGSVSGIQPGSLVAVRGVRVGKVDEVQLYADDRQSVRLVLAIDRKVPIDRDAVAQLSFQGVTGVKYVDISGGSAGELPPGSHIAYHESALERVSDQAEALVEQAKELLASTNKLVVQLGRVAERFDQTRIDAILDETQRAAGTFAAAGSELKGLIHENRAPLSRALSSADVALRGASGTLKNADDTVLELKTMIRQNEAQLRAITSNLRDASQSFKDLGQQLRQRPSRLLLSGAQPERELP
ncbi:MAG TPA: MlaD family protein [Polyangiales bacterium]|nr:MlaD family protein [Polyangiales bacterium]